MIHQYLRWEFLDICLDFYIFIYIYIHNKFTTKLKPEFKSIELKWHRHTTVHWHSGTLYSVWYIFFKRWRKWYWGFFVWSHMLFKKMFVYLFVEVHPWALALEMELESCVLINNKSAHWWEDRRRIEKDNKGLPCALYFTQLHLSALTLLHRPLTPKSAKETLWMSPCKHKATCYSSSLDCANVFAACCPSTIHYQCSPDWILNKTTIQAPATSTFQDEMQQETAMFILKCYIFLSLHLAACINLRGCLQITLLSSIVVQQSILLWIEKTRSARTPSTLHSILHSPAEMMQ